MEVGIVRSRYGAGHTKSVDCEQLLQSFKQAGSGIRMLRLQMLGMHFEFLDAGTHEPRVHCVIWYRAIVTHEQTKKYPVNSCRQDYSKTANQ